MFSQHFLHRPQYSQKSAPLPPQDGHSGMTKDTGYPSTIVRPNPQKKSLVVHHVPLCASRRSTGKSRRVQLLSLFSVPSSQKADNSPVSELKCSSGTDSSLRHQYTLCPQLRLYSFSMKLSFTMILKETGTRFGLQSMMAGQYSVSTVFLYDRLVVLDSE